MRALISSLALENKCANFRHAIILWNILGKLIKLVLVQHTFEHIIALLFILNKLVLHDLWLILLLNFLLNRGNVELWIDNCLLVVLMRVFRASIYRLNSGFCISLSMFDYLPINQDILYTEIRITTKFFWDCSKLAEWINSMQLCIGANVCL